MSDESSIRAFIATAFFMLGAIVMLCFAACEASNVKRMHNDWLSYKIKMARLDGERDCLDNKMTNIGDRK